MNTPSLPIRAAAFGLLWLAAGASGAAVVQTLGRGSAVDTVHFSADFSANTTLSNPYAEGGLVVSHTGFADDNGGCGYAGSLCVDIDAGERYSAAFEGNHYATAGLNAFVRVASVQAPMAAIEFAADSGFGSVHLLWQTWLDGLLTGSGRLSLGAGGVGGVVGLRDARGFNELRVYAFDSASDTSGYSAAAIDSVRAQAVPLPGTLALALAGLAVMALRGAGPRRGYRAS